MFYVLSGFEELILLVIEIKNLFYRITICIILLKRIYSVRYIMAAHRKYDRSYDIQHFLEV